MRGGGVEIRPVRPEEHAAVGELTVGVYGDILGEHLSDAYKALLGDVAHRAAEAVVLVAVDSAGNVLGSVTYVPGPGPYAEFEEADEAGVRMLGVVAGAQRRGVGTLLMQACIERARHEGRRRLSLHTTPEMTAAHRLYERLGFRRAPERDWVPEAGVSLLSYVLELRDG